MTIEEKALELLENKEQAMLAVVLFTKGSSPRDKGAKMIVYKNGETYDTVGGGPMEFAVCKSAAAIIENGETAVKRFDLGGKDTERSASICGGEAVVCLHALEPDDIPSLREVCSAIREGRKARYIIKQTAPGKAVISSKEIDGGTACAENILYVCEPVAAERLYLCGAGHVSLETAKIAQIAGFDITVIDDREEFATPKRFPNAECIVADRYDSVPTEKVRENDYIVIATRGHKDDRHALDWALKTKACYIGMIGSKKKRDMIYDTLAEQGVSRERLAEVHSPIGLPIGGRLPGEIGVSIVAELIQCRAEKGKSEEQAAHEGKEK